MTILSTIKLKPNFRNRISSKNIDKPNKFKSKWEYKKWKAFKPQYFTYKKRYQFKRIRFFWKFKWLVNLIKYKTPRYLIFRKKPKKIFLKKKIYITKILSYCYSISNIKEVKNLIKYSNRAKSIHTISTIKNFINILESKLSLFIVRIGYSPNVYASKSIITLGNVIVNGKKNYKPNYNLKTGDIVQFTKTYKDKLVNQMNINHFLYSNFNTGVYNRSHWRRWLYRKLWHKLETPYRGHIIPQMLIAKDEFYSHPNIYSKRFASIMILCRKKKKKKWFFVYYHKRKKPYKHEEKHFKSRGFWKLGANVRSASPKRWYTDDEKEQKKWKKFLRDMNTKNKSSTKFQKRVQLYLKKPDYFSKKISKILDIKINNKIKKFNQIYLSLKSKKIKKTIYFFKNRQLIHWLKLSELGLKKELQKLVQLKIQKNKLTRFLNNFFLSNTSKLLNKKESIKPIKISRNPDESLKSRITNRIIFNPIKASDIIKKSRILSNQIYLNKKK